MGPAADVDVLGIGIGCDEALTLDVVVGVGATTAAEVVDVAGVGTGFAGAAVFWKQVQALDSLDTGTPTKLLGIVSVGVVRNLGQKTAASLENLSNARSVLSS